VAKAKTKKYKLKTHKATAKRFRVTAGGKVVRTKGGKSHLRRRTPKRTKRQFKKLIGIAGKKDQRRVKRLAPYLGKYRSNPGK
jgi:large subunit ribosomal protein L35